jgi:hypothetical protein
MQQILNRYLFHGDKSDMRILLSVTSLILLSAFTGSGMSIQYGTLRHKAPKVNTSLFLAMSGAPTNDSQVVVNAHNDDRLNDLEKAEQVSFDDRKILHDEIYKLAQTENAHFAALHEQLSNDETRLNVSTSVIGFGVTILNGLALWMQISDRKRISQLVKQEKGV